MKLTKSKLKEMIEDEFQNLDEDLGFAVDSFDMGSTYIAPERHEKEPTKTFFKKYSSPEARKIVERGVKDYALILRKAQQKIIKDWMQGAKAGVFDYFDLVRAFNYGEANRAYPYELEFLRNVLKKDNVEDRFKAYFKGKKSKVKR